jgi:chromosome transmission fidelity protein 1
MKVVGSYLEVRSLYLDSSLFNGAEEANIEKREKRCQYLPSMDDETGLTDFRDQILVGSVLPLTLCYNLRKVSEASPKDIEDLASVGRMSNMCPYFASRRAIPQAEVGTLGICLIFMLNLYIHS